MYKTLRPRRKNTKHGRPYILSYKCPALATATSFGYRDDTRRPHIMFYTLNNISHGIKSSVNNSRIVVAILYRTVFGRSGDVLLLFISPYRDVKIRKTLRRGDGTARPPFRPAGHDIYYIIIAANGKLILQSGPRLPSVTSDKQ